MHGRGSSQDLTVDDALNIHSICGICFLMEWTNLQPRLESYYMEQDGFRK
jgi:hypothetical protein